MFSSFRFSPGCRNSDKELQVWVCTTFLQRSEGGWTEKVWGFSRYQWLMPIVQDTQKAEIGRIVVGSQPRQIVLRKHMSKKSFIKKGWQSGSRCRSWVQAPVPQKSLRTKVDIKLNKKMHKLMHIHKYMIYLYNCLTFQALLPDGIVALQHFCDVPFDFHIPFPPVFPPCQFLWWY
jgi:hypothetical protein